MAADLQEIELSGFVYCIYLSIFSLTSKGCLCLIMFDLSDLFIFLQVIQVQFAIYWFWIMRILL